MTCKLGVRGLTGYRRFMLTGFQMWRLEVWSVGVFGGEDLVSGNVFVSLD